MSRGSNLLKKRLQLSTIHPHITSRSMLSIVLLMPREIANKLSRMGWVVLILRGQIDLLPIDECKYDEGFAPVEEQCLMVRREFPGVHSSWRK